MSTGSLLVRVFWFRSRDWVPDNSCRMMAKLVLVEVCWNFFYYI